MQDVNQLSPTHQFKDAFDGFLDLYPDTPELVDRPKAAVAAAEVSYRRAELLWSPNSTILVAAGMVAALSVGVLLALWI